MSEYRVTCAGPGCRKTVKGQRKMYCSDQCGRRAAQRRYYYRQKAKKDKDGTAEQKAYYQERDKNRIMREIEGEPPPPEGEMKEDARVFGAVARYDEYEDKYGDLVAMKVMELADVAAIMDISYPHATRMHRRWVAERERDRAAEDWTPPEPYAEDPIEDFILFRAAHFKTPDGKPYSTPSHQRKWITEVWENYIHGTCLAVLSPPRHGKTELLTHFCVWLIVRNPNIRIIYIGGSAEIAEQSTDMVKDHLENTDSLAMYLPPGKFYMPRQKSGRNWTRSRFTVGTRTVSGIKSPTMVAVGRGGKMPSRDADIIIVDDPEDHDSTLQPGTREDTRGWWAKSVMSRKEDQTSIFVIGSRVHPDDLLYHIITSPEFESIIEQAHDPTCELSTEDLDAHVDCMLWPEVRTYKWLMKKKNDPMQAMFFQMVYQNESLDSDLAHFAPEDIDACKDPTRPLGHIPARTRLVAGLDPSVSGYQAAFLWAVDITTGRRYMVDLDNRLGGGIDPAHEIMQRWYHAYDCRIWVVEENLYHGAIIADEKIRKWAQANYVTIEGHETWGTNKWDIHFGVTAMGRHFKAEIEVETPGGKSLVRGVSLPTGDEAGRLKVKDYRTQLINFNRDASAIASRRKRSRTLSDIVMASWFPEETIRRWSHEEGEIEVTYTQTHYPFAGMSLSPVNWG